MTFFLDKRFSLRTLLNSVRSRRQTAANSDSVIFVHPNGHSDKPSPSAPGVGSAGGRSSSPLDGTSNPELENLKGEPGTAAFGDMGAGMGGPGLGGAGERSLSPIGMPPPGLAGGQGMYSCCLLFHRPGWEGGGRAVTAIKYSIRETRS